MTGNRLMDSFFNHLDLIQPLQCIEMDDFSLSPICVCGLLKYETVSSIQRNSLHKKIDVEYLVTMYQIFIVVLPWADIQQYEAEVIRTSLKRLLMFYTSEQRSSDTVPLTTSLFKILMAQLQQFYSLEVGLFLLGCLVLFCLGF